MGKYSPTVAAHKDIGNIFRNSAQSNKNRPNLYSDLMSRAKKYFNFNQAMPSRSDQKKKKRG